MENLYSVLVDFSEHFIFEKILDLYWKDLARTNSLTPFVKGVCFKISEGFDRISILFEKCDATERENRFERLRELLKMNEGFGELKHKSSTALSNEVIH